MEKGAKDLNSNFSKEDIQMANKHIREMQFKTTIRCHFIRTRIAKTFLKRKITSVSNDVEKLEPLYIVAGGNVKW